jgi:acyl phosphate:glycerol-3-phosphate acyltransferase
MIAGLVVLAFLCGSIPFGVLITRWKLGVDVRSQGSGNIGATNVARVAGKRLGIFVLVLDALKGAVPVLLVLRLLPDALWVHAGVGLAAFLGHVFPPWLKFRGGKGVATALGVLLTLVPLAALAGGIAYLAVFLTMRVSSIGSLLGGTAAVLVAFALDHPRPYATLTAVLFVLMIWTHRGNLKRIAARTESKL